jgi:hypothetical protein
MGQFVRRMALYQASQTDNTNQSPDQVKALQMEAMSLVKDISKLSPFVDQLNSAMILDQSNNMEQELAKVADAEDCLLYGALDLNEDQFAQVNGILQSALSQAEQQNLLSTNELPTGAHESLRQLNARVIPL